MTGIFVWLNMFPGWKRRAAAIAALVVGVVQLWNSTVPEFGHGPCLATPDQIADALKAVSTCAADWTLKIPDTINAIIVALMGVGVASGAQNDKADIMASVKQSAKTSTQIKDEKAAL